MIHLFYYELKLLSPLFYRTSPDSGASGATTTGPWVGDIALDYAINASLGVKRLPSRYSESKPDYTDLLELPFLSTMAVPKGSVNFTRVYDIATNFISQGFFDAKSFNKSANAPERNWLKRQGLAPKNTFTFAIVTEGDWMPPNEFTVRLGNMKETLASCRKTDKPERIDANLFTTTMVLNHLHKQQNPQEIIRKLYPGHNDYQSMMEYVMPQYIIMRDVDLNNWLECIERYH